MFGREVTTVTSMVYFENHDTALRSERRALHDPKELAQGIAWNSQVRNPRRFGTLEIASKKGSVRGDKDD